MKKWGSFHRIFVEGKQVGLFTNIKYKWHLKKYEEKQLTIILILISNYNGRIMYQCLTHSYFVIEVHNNEIYPIHSNRKFSLNVDLKK